MSNPLVDQFGREHTYLRISLTDRCNFRCRYCMPNEGIEWRPKHEILTLEEIERLVELFATLGITKVRLTGGEPTLRRGIEGLMERISRIDGISTLLMTTNGTTLAAHAHEYRLAGLSGVNISLDTLRRDRFKELTQRDELSRVMDGIEAALDAGLYPVKINMVVMQGVNHDEILDLLELARDRPLQIRFIEFMPFAGNRWSKASVLPYRDMRRIIEGRFRIEQLPTDRSAVGKDFRIDGFKGTVSFVTSMTEDFCDGCNRLRLTADGALKVCLFSAGEVSLRDLLRSGAVDSQLEERIRDTLWKKWRGHPPIEILGRVPNRSMVVIGG